MTTKPRPKAKPAAVKKVAVKKSGTTLKKAAAAGTSKKVAAKAAPAAGKAKLKQTAKADKPVKIKMVRDSYSMSEGDYANLLGLKKKCIAAGVHAKKSELLRVGLMGLMKLSNASLLAAVKQVVVSKKAKSAKA